VEKDGSSVFAALLVHKGQKSRFFDNDTEVKLDRQTSPHIASITVASGSQNQGATNHRKG
jgi:hypothetical protein